MKNRNVINTILKRLFTSFFFLICGINVYAQSLDSIQNYSIVKEVIEKRPVAENNHQVISNPFKDNWFVLGGVGVNAFWGDFTIGNLSTRITPQFNIGFGKWFVPGFGAKVQFAGFESKELKSVQTENTLDSDTFYDKNGSPYWKENIKWWDISLNLMINISRLFAGYEGADSPKMKNQFIFSIGAGATHQYDVPIESNAISGHLELLYSRFFSEKKNISLDICVREILYETHFDLVNKQRIDDNLSLNVGFTYYFKNRGWERTIETTTYYVEDHSTINKLMEEIKQLRNAATSIDAVVIKQ